MLILERTDVIEKKDASTNTNMAKKNAWREVLSRFNAITSVNRDMLQIQNQWRNMKNRAKKAEFAYRSSRAMTGGGPPPPSPTLEDKEIMEAIPQEFQIDRNFYDSDSNYFNQEQQKNKVQSALPPVVKKNPSLALEQRLWVMSNSTINKENTASASTQLQLCSMEQGRKWEHATPPPVSKIKQSSAVFQEQGNWAQSTSPLINKESPGEESSTSGLLKRKWKGSGPSHFNMTTDASSVPKPSLNKRYTQKNKKYNSKCCSEDHEHQIFLMQIKHREEIMRQEKEAHERRMSIMFLEEEYWEKKKSQLGTLLTH